MDTVAEAPRLLAALLPDGGARMLEDGGLGGTWKEALAHVPPQVLQVPAQAAGLRILTRLRDFWANADDLRPALAASRALLDLRARVAGPTHPDTLTEISALGALVARAGRVEEGAQLVQQAYTGLRDQKVSDLRLAVVASNLGQSRLRLGDDAGAEAVLREAYAIQRRLAPKSVGLLAAQLAELCLRSGRDEEALPLAREAHELTRGQVGPDHPRTLARARTLGRAYARLQRWEQAAASLRPVHLARARQPLDDDSASVAFELGMALCRSQQLEEGVRCMEASLRWTRDEERRSGEVHPMLPDRLAEWAQVQLMRRRADEAEGLLLEALDVEKRLSGEGSIEVAARYLELGRFMMRSGRMDEALGWVDPAASLHRTLLGDAHPATRVAVEVQLELLVGRAQAAGRDKALARELLEAGLAAAGPVLGYVHPKVRAAREKLDSL